MSSVPKGKKAVSQDDLRRLMREKKRSTEREKRVDAPHARYNGLGQLSCALCNAPVKSALLWQTHVLGKQHKDRVNALKHRESSPTPAPSSSSSSSSSGVKRSAPPSACPPPSEKRAKSSVTAGADQPAVSSRPSVGLGLLAGHYDDEDEDAGAPERAPGLPEGFFDSSVTPDPPAPPAGPHSGSVTQAGAEDGAGPQRKEGPEVLPEGFFDDPVRDAQVRQVDAPMDHMDREWEEFQREMRPVHSASDAIVAQDDEQGRLERQIHEIDQQIQCFRRVEVLRARQEVRRRGAGPRQEVKRGGARGEMWPEEEEDEDDEEELMHVLTQDWRAKGALA